MARVMLDTDVCIDAMRGRSLAIRSHLERMAIGEVVISAIVAAELWTGVMKSRRPKAAENAVRKFLSYVEVLDWPVGAARVYGDIRAHLEASGRSIGAVDMLIAAHAIVEKIALVTRNQSEFRRVAGLQLEDWSASDAA
jgi:tRNA(fMet)-specific endonuclease VapC